MTQDEINDKEWHNPENWRLGWLHVYMSQADTRVWVPKRKPGIGYTVNLGHRGGMVILLVLIAAILFAAMLGVLDAARSGAAAP
jgi:uncharacterized membrane protein